MSEGAEKMTQELIPLPEAMAALKAHMVADPELAWGWYCNIVMPIIDATSVPHDVADQTSAFLMFHLFDYDMTTHPRYTSGKPVAQKYAEMRIAAEREEDAMLAAAVKP